MKAEWDELSLTLRITVIVFLVIATISLISGSPLDHDMPL